MTILLHPTHQLPKVARLAPLEMGETAVALDEDCRRDRLAGPVSHTRDWRLEVAHAFGVVLAQMLGVATESLTREIKGRISDSPFAG